MNIIKDKTSLKAIAKKYSLTFCSIFGYYEGNAYNNDKGEYLPNYFEYNGRVFKLKYFDGCFNPFLVECAGKFAYHIKTFEPLFKVENWMNPDPTKFIIA